jgi:maltooligosyltrehalose trehalohydrolase
MSLGNGGMGMDAQWSDDFHHCVHTLLTGENGGYYEDYGGVRQLAKALQEGFVYSGEYSPYRRRTHGSSGRNIPAERFVICSQNHDQIGNRLLGERLTQLVSFEQLKLAAGVVLLSPNVPMLFMGEEYGETAPFQYFISHTDADLVEAVREGRRKEFESFGWEVDPPDPQDEAAFNSCKLDHSLRNGGKHKALFDFYRDLIRLRKSNSALAKLDKDSLETQACENAKVLFVRRWSDSDEVVILHNFDESSRTITLPIPQGHWRKQLDSAGEEWEGSGSPVPEYVVSDGEESITLAAHSFVLLVRDNEE